MYHLIVIQPTEKRRHVIILHALIVVVMYGKKLVAKRHDLVVLISLAICVSGVPAYAKPRMVYKLDKLIGSFGT